jgi:hypothetical protein
VARADLCLDVDTPPSPPRATSVIQVCVVDAGFLDGRNRRVSPALVPTFHNEVALREILQQFRQSLSPVECRADDLRITAGKLKKGVRADGHALEREEDLHILYRLTWYATESDVTREANDGRGPVDFKVSRGSKDKTLVEFKLAKNSQLQKNLLHQAEIYQKASDADRAIKVIIYFTAAEKKRVDGILNKLKLDGHKDLILIDARKDNKPSGSKARA